MTTLSIGCTFSDRIEALLDGRISIAGYDATIQCVEAQRLFRQTLREQRYDVAELSMGTHIAAVAKGDRHYVGLPIFLSRSFRHANLYIRSDRGIGSPANLAGRRIGLVDFQQTAALWLRGLLDDDHDVARRSISWVTAGLHAPVLEDRMAMSLPADVLVERSPSTLDQLLRDGTLDAIISPTAPRCFVEGDARVARLWPDYREQELAYWRRHRLFPIMHVLVLRRSLADADPGLARAICGAFEAARHLAATDLAHRDFPKLSLPWLMNLAHAAHADLGTDPWTYGIEPNRATLATMLRYAKADGLIADDLRIEQLFDASTWLWRTKT